jgi:hypothetical protein
MTDDAQVPIRTLDYSVSRADALAFTMLRHELTGWDKFRLLVVVGVAGLLAGLVPDDLGRTAWWLAVGVILALGAGAAILWTNIDVRRRASALPIPVGQVSLRQWDDHLSQHHATWVRRVDYDRILHVTCTQGHVFIRVDEVPVILPAAAFANMDDMQAFAADIDERSERSAT